MDRLSKLADTTLLPLGLVILLMGAAMYIANDHAVIQASAKDIETLQQHQDDYIHDIEKIDMRLSHIEGALGVKFGRPAH
jgi:hypothetical protein